jgi:biopolymer transport protein ExbB/TolQ
MERVCPYCESTEITPETVEGEKQATVLRCASCGRSSLSGEPSERDASSRSSDAGKPSSGDFDGVLRIREGRSFGGFLKRSRDQRGAPGEVSSWPSAAVAFASTILFYGLLEVLPHSEFSELFMERGWVPYVITLISSWALFLLAAKFLRLGRERRILDQNLVATNSNGHIRPEDAAGALTALDEMRTASKAISESFLARRVERALRHFQSRRRSVEVVEFLATESRSDENRVDASYGLVRVFVWAVPTLGFIGTVIGIGAAVAGFSETLEAASSLDGMKESIGLVTGGLGVAFDTTLLALVMSILIMFPTSAMQRIEEAFLSDVDEYCAEILIPALVDVEGGTANATIDAAVIVALADRLVASMRAADRRES